MIQLEHIFKTFGEGPSAVHAVSDVSLSVKKGEIFGIIGFSGAGKSTLVRCINLLERPTSGSVRVDGVELTALSKTELRKKRRSIGMIFQLFNLMPARTVAGNIALALRHSPLSRAEKEAKIRSLLELVGLADRADAYPSQLSGGQKQRVAIARALANDPKVLLCDEATSALDPQTTHSILRLIADLNRKLGLTVVVITHQMGVIKEICHRVAVMENGRVVEEGSVVDIFTSPRAPLTRNFIGTANNVTKFLELVKSGHFDSAASAGARILLLTYSGASAGEPVIIRLYEKFRTTASVIYGNIDFIAGTEVGNLGIALSGEPRDVDAAIEYLRTSGVRTEVLK